MLTTAPHYRDITVQDHCRIIIPCGRLVAILPVAGLISGRQNISWKLHLVMNSPPVSAVRQLTTSTMTVGLLGMLGSALLIETM